MSHCRHSPQHRKDLCRGRRHKASILHHAVQRFERLPASEHVYIGYQLLNMAPLVPLLLMVASLSCSVATSPTTPVLALPCEEPNCASNIGPLMSPAANCTDNNQEDWPALPLRLPLGQGTTLIITQSGSRERQLAKLLKR